MICSAPFVLIILFVQAALALPQAGDAGASTPPMSTTPYSSTGTPNTSYPSSTPTPYSTTGSTPAYTSSSSSYESSSSSSSSCTCPPSTPPAYPPMMDKNSISYSSSGPSSVYSSSSCSCHSSTPYSSQPTYTSSSSYSPSSSSYPPTESTYPPKESKPYPPPSKPSQSPQPPTTSPSATLRTTFDTTFDNKSGSMNNVACSNGANGLAARFPTFGDVPSFPLIGGAFDVVWNSPNCGSCWNLTNAATGASINIVAVDTAGAGFNIAQEAFEKLNGGQVGQGFLDVFATKVSPSDCGL